VKLSNFCGAFLPAFRIFNKLFLDVDEDKIDIVRVADKEQKRLFVFIVGVCVSIVIVNRILNNM